MSIPQVPPRPARSSHQHPPLSGMDVPQVPPRPHRRTSDRSQSPPDRDHFPRSPFNEPPSRKPLGKNPSGLTMTPLDDSAEVKLPKRPSSVSLPTIGQEGNEYAEVVDMDPETAEAEERNSGEPKQTRNVAGDLPLHAPKPSFTKDNAKQRVAAVTRTDSGQAAALGIGKSPTPSGSVDPETGAKRSVSFRPPSAASTERPASAQQYDDEQGIPEIGQRVPMHPDAGDVQAPSSTPGPQSPSGIGFHNSGYAKPKHHRRTQSGREILPPGSYGLHGHGMQSTDQFEQQWYAKHPDALEKEEGEYGPGIAGARAEWAMSSDDLNKLVHGTAKKKEVYVGPPSEQIGYQASEDYSSRVQSPHSAATRTWTESSQPHIQSPLRKASFPVDADAHAEIRKMENPDPATRSLEQALESETEDEELHIAPPTTRRGKYTSTNYDAPKANLGPQGGNTDEQGGFVEETGYGVPILASDEVARAPSVEFLQPAISPTASRRGSSYYTGQDFDQPGISKSFSRGGSAANSRPSSRPGSIHKLSLYDDDRDAMHTPLEDVDEYEPLFPDEHGNKKPLTVAQRLKMREQMKRFPSQDIWEDTPNSLQLQATVDTPEPADSPSAAKPKAPAAAFETPEQEARRKGEVTEHERTKLLSREERLAKSNFKPHVLEEVERPNLKQRFPSKDIWEDSPDSAELTTVITGDKAPDVGLEAGAIVQTPGAPKDGVIAGEQARDRATEGAPAVERPAVPPRPARNRAASPGEETSQHPPIPTRPPKRLHQVPPADAKVPIAPSKLAGAVSPTADAESSPTDLKKVPSLPEKPKPQIPARPSRPPPAEQEQPAALSKVTSASSAGSEGSEKTEQSGVAKAKPAVPARPTGSKIAALQGGFLADLNSRLKLGRQSPKSQEKELEAEPEEEKAPLGDARKGRAKGPVKRKPAAAAAVAPAESQVPSASWTMIQPSTVWQTNERGKVSVTQARTTPSATQATTTQTDEPASAGGVASPSVKSLAAESDLPTPAVEAERNPLSAGTTSPAVDAPNAGVSPLASGQPQGSGDEDALTKTNPQAQSGDTETALSPETGNEEKPTATAGDTAQTSST